MTSLSKLSWLAIVIALAGRAEAAGQVVGSVPGSISVSLSGSATYAVSLKIPPGTAGTEPAIQLLYNSQSLGGALGAGWAISGLSVITRGPRDQFTDGTITGINFDENDALYLDGQRLIPVFQSGSGATMEIEYRKVADDQTRITRIGADFENSFFKAETKGGVILVFNGKEGSRVKTNGVTLLMAQSLSLDTAGNYIQYEYETNDKGNYDIKNIKYTGHGRLNSAGLISSDQAPHATISFSYETARPVSSYMAGRPLVRDNRLKEISTQITSQSNAISRYVLDYDERPNANRFTLARIRQFGSDGTELKPTTFAYSKPPFGWSEAPFQLPSSVVLAGRERLALGYRFAHVSPAGTLPDLLFAAQVEGKLEAFAFKNELDALTPKWTALDGFKPPIAFSNEDGADLGVIVEDVRGGGRVSLLQAYQKTGADPVVAALRAGANGFEADDGYKLPFLVSFDGKVVAKYRFAKFSGGAGPDLLYQSRGLRGFLKNTGSGWDPDPLHQSPVEIDERLFVIDIDCSGRPALLSAAPDGAGGFAWKVFRYAAGQGWQPETGNAFQPPFPAATDPGAIRQIRFSSSPNSCPGLIVASAAAGGIRGAFVTSSAGWVTLGANKVPNFDLVDVNGDASHAIVMDVDGDNLPDVIAHTKLSNGSIVKFAYRQTNSQWQADPNFEPPLLVSLEQSSIQPNIFVGDIDGKFGSDIISVSDARILAGDPQEKFGNIVISTGTRFETQATFSPPVQFARRDKQDRGVRILDLHGLGLPDIIFRREITSNGTVATAQGSYRNTGAGWVEEPGLAPPAPFASDEISGNPAQFADVSGSGVPDMIYSYKDKTGSINCHLYRNIPDGPQSRKWSDVATDNPELMGIIPPTCNAVDGQVFPLSAAKVGDGGVRFVKLNKDRLGMLVGIMPPKQFDTNGQAIPVQTCTTDGAGSTSCELDRSLFQAAAYLFDGTKWVPAPQYSPKLPFVAQVASADEPRRDLFVQLLDVNQDGLPDLVARFRHPHDDTVEINEVWLNTGDGWQLDKTLSVPYPLDAPYREPKTLIQWADVNGDGVPDIVLSKRDGGSNLSSTWLGTGRGWEASPNPNWQIPIEAIADRDGDPAFRLADTKGDGFLDILFGRQKADGTNEFGAFINNGTDWKTPAATGSVPSFAFIDKDGLDLGVRVLSVTGRGLSDIVQSFGGDAPKVQLNKSRRADVLAEIAEGMGLRTRIFYQSLLEADNADANYSMPRNLLGTRVYHRGYPDPYPLIAPVPTSYVVRRVAVDEGGGRGGAFSYRYGDYRVDIVSMRSLGFRWRESLNEANGFLTRTELLQDSRFSSSTLRESTCWQPVVRWQSIVDTVPDDLCPLGVPTWSEWIRKLSEVRNCWGLSEGDVAGGAIATYKACRDAKPAPSPSQMSGQPLRVRQVELASSVSEQFELDGGRISQSSDQFVYGSDASILDRRPNVLSTETVLHDGSSIRTQHQYQDNPARWHLGRVVASVVTRVGDPISAGSPARKTEIRETRFSYDSETGLLSEQTANARSEKAVTTTYRRDEFGNIIRTSVTALGESPRVIEAVYDAKGRFVLESTNALGHVVRKVSDPGSGLPLSVIDINGLAIGYEYDGFGRVRRQTNPDGVSATTRILELSELGTVFPDADVTSGVVAAFASITQVDSLPKVVTLFDSKSRPVRTIKNGFTPDATENRYVFVDKIYDVLGRVAKVSQPYEIGQHPAFTSTETDVLGRTIKTTTPNRLSTVTEYKSMRTAAVGYSPAVPAQSCLDLGPQAPVGGGEVWVTIDPGGLARKSYSCVNARKELMLSVDSKKGSVQYTYDAGGRVERMTGATGAITEHKYDDAGNRVETTDPDLGTWQYSYDPFGQVVRQIDAKRQLATIEYDVLNRPLRRQQNDGMTTWIYDQARYGIGKVASIEMSNGYRETYSYDRLGRPTSVAAQIGTEQLLTSKAYDRLSRPNVTYYPTGFAVRNEYDQKGFLRKVVDDRSRATFWSAQAIDVYGRVVEEMLGNGVVTHRKFQDLTNRVENIKAVDDRGHRIIDLKLEYDKIGNLKDRRESVEQKHEKFDYDELDRLSSMTDSDHNHSRYRYDAAGRLVFKEGIGSYHYVHGQHETDGDNAKPFHAVLYTEHGGNEHRFKYDRNGNMLAAPKSHYEYTSDNRLRLMFQADEAWTLFDYGPSGDRFRQFVRDGKKSTETLYAPGYERVVEHNVARPTLQFGRLTRHRHYLTNSSGVFAVFETDDKYISQESDWSKKPHSPRPIGEMHFKETWYMHADQLGSVLRVTDQSGKVRQTAWYDPWGARKLPNPVPSSGDVGLGKSWARGFTGHDQSDGLALVHMNGRVYSSALSIFLTVDAVNQAVTDTQTGNGYMYVRGNPLRFTDPTGFGFFDDVLDVITAPVRWVGDRISDVARGVGHFFSEAGKWLSENWRMVVVVIAVVVVTVVTMGALGPAAATLGGAILTGMAAGATAGGLTAALYGGSIDDVLTAAITGAAIGGATAGVTYGIGSYYGGLAKAQGTLTVGQEVSSVAAHGVVGGLSEGARGGNFWSGFAGGAAATALQSFGPKFETRGANTVKAAVTGGTVSVISGGKFANGAISGALAYSLTPSSRGGPVYKKGSGGVAYVGGFFDKTINGPALGEYNEFDGPNKAYFTWDQGDALAKWIDENGGNVDVIAHSYGADTAASVVAAGHSVNSLTTVDPVSWFRPDYSSVAANSNTWIDYDARGGGVTMPNIIAGVGGAWNSGPKGYADTYEKKTQYDHADIMTHCGKLGGCR
jgi:RHS repeat-associated protein